MTSLIPQIIQDWLELYITLDKPIYRLGSEARLYILLGNRSDSRRQINVRVIEDGGKEVIREEIEVQPSYSTVDLEYPLPEKTGTHDLTIMVDGKVFDKVKFIVASPEDRDPVLSTIVWHHHQAPNYDPEFRVHSIWAYIYVWGDHLKPYGKGPYHYHATLLEKYRSFKSTYNLSPSLLKQWLMIIENGVVFTDGKTVGKDSFESKLVKETVELYKHATRRGQIDVLTSIYAHTIAGFLTDALDLDDVIRDEIEYGLKVTREALGEWYEPRGIWLPEMAFSMKLVNIINDLGLRYTVLDEVHHYRGAVGDKMGCHKPYLLVDKSSGKHITVFFRDTELSNILSFKNNFVNEIHAWRNAYEFSYLLAAKWLDKTAKTHVIALDGENWMVFSKNPSLTAYFMDKLVLYLVAMDNAGFIKLSTLREIYHSVPAIGVLTHIPTASWLGAFRKWFGEIGDHAKGWLRVSDTVRKLRAYEKMIGCRDDYSEKARWSLWHALDSDYWWAEFWLPSVIDTWLTQCNRILDERLKLVKIKNIKVIRELVEDQEAPLLIEVENNLEREVYVVIAINGSVDVSGGNEIPVRIKAKSTLSREVLVKPKRAGRYVVEVMLISSNYVIDAKTMDVYVNPMIRSI